MGSPNWLGASPGFVGLSGQINQFLGSHASVFGYSGSVLQASGGSGAATYLSTDGVYYAQEFTTGASQTAVGSVALQLSTVGGSPITETISPITVGLYASSFGVPTGSPLAQATLVEEYVYTSPFWVSVPLAATGLTASTPYQIVTTPAGTGTAYYVWQQTAALFGASTAPDGVTWTNQAYGFMYQVYDNSGSTGNPILLTDDGGARYTAFTYSSSGQPVTITEYTQTQNGLGLLQTRTITYSGNYVTGMS